MIEDHNTARAHVDYDPLSDGLRIIASPRPRTLLLWGQLAYRTETEDEPAQVAPPEAYLRLDRDTARAIYEALADYFGHNTTDTRRLRQDYDAERKRVDKFIDATIRTITTP